MIKPNSEKFIEKIGELPELFYWGLIPVALLGIYLTLVDIKKVRKAKRQT